MALLGRRGSEETVLPGSLFSPTLSILQHFIVLLWFSCNALFAKKYRLPVGILSFVLLLHSDVGDLKNTGCQLVCRLCCIIV